MLDLWLSGLETTMGADQIAVTIDTCKSDSFIDVTNSGLAEISATNRIVVISTHTGQSFPYG